MNNDDKAKRKAPPRALPPARPLKETLVISADTFGHIVKAMYNTTEDLGAMARDIAELKLMLWRVNETMTGLATDIANIARQVDARMVDANARPPYQPPQGYQPAPNYPQPPQPAPRAPATDLRGILRSIPGAGGEPILEATEAERLIPRR